MKKKHISSLSIFLIFISLILFSCELSTQNDVGNLTITLNSETSKSFEPEISMEVASYSISGTGPNGREFGPITSEEDEITVTDLYKGDWTITAEAFNEDGDSLGQGSSEVTIIGSKTNNTNITVKEHEGTGSIEFEINLPEVAIDNLQIVATIESFFIEDSEDPEELSFTIDEETNTSTLTQDDVPNGYYTLSFDLYDGAIDDDDNIYGKVDIIRVVKDQTTNVNLTLSASDVNITGDLEVSINNNIIISPVATISPTDVSIYEGETQEFCVTVEQEDDYQYEWYVDGELKSSESDCYTIDDNLSLGNHNIDVLIFSDDIVTTASTSFTINENLLSYVKVTLSDIDTKEIEHQFLLKFGLNELENVFSSDNLDYECDDIGDLYAYKLNAPKYGETIDFFAFNKDINSFNFSEDFIPPEEYMMTFIDLSTNEDDNNIQSGWVEFSTNLIFTEYDIVEFSIDSIDNDLEFILSKYGDVGEKIIGTVTCEDVTFYGSNYSVEDPELEQNIPNFDVEIQFNLTRADNIDFQMIDYKENGGSGKISDKTFIKDSVITVEDPTGILTKEDYEFAYWNTEEDGTGDTYNIGDTISFEEDSIVLYAIWTESISN
jgi:hypothetical protein